MAAALVALIAAGVLLLAAVLVLARRASRMSRSLSLVEGRLGLSPGGAAEPGVVSAALDRREAASAGRQRDAERLQEALDAAGSGVLVVDPTGAVVFANRAALPYLSGRPGEAVVEAGVSEAVSAALVDGRGRAAGNWSCTCRGAGWCASRSCRSTHPAESAWGQWPTSPTSPRSAGWRRCGGTSWPTWATS